MHMRAKDVCVCVYIKIHHLKTIKWFGRSDNLIDF